MYQPEPISLFTSDWKTVASYVLRQLQLIANAFDRAIAREIEFLHVEPQRPRDGLIVGADGTDWDPGAGAGVYCYYGAAWHKLG